VSGNGAGVGRHGLTPGKPQTLDFTAGRLVSRRLDPGSRVVAQFSLVESPAAEVNYGCGKDVSLETSAGAGSPLRVDWPRESFLDLPISR